MASDVTLIAEVNEDLKSRLDSFIRCCVGKPDACLIVGTLPHWLRDNVHYYSSNVGTVKAVDSWSLFSAVHTGSVLVANYFWTEKFRLRDSRLIQSVTAWKKTLRWTAPKILFAVTTCHRLEYGSREDCHHRSGVNDRVQALRQTWLQDFKTFAQVDHNLFYGRGDREPLGDEVFLDVPDDYEHLPEKTIAICQWARQQGYEYVVRCDDDTAMDVEPFLWEALRTRPDYGGYVQDTVCSGMAYWLSAKGINFVADSKPCHWAEDVHVAKVMEAQGIKPVNLIGIKKWKWVPGSQGHAWNPVSPEDMLVWYRTKGGK